MEGQLDTEGMVAAKLFFAFLATSLLLSSFLATGLGTALGLLLPNNYNERTW